MSEKKKFDKEGIRNIAIVTVSLCLVASLVVSFASVSLKDLQEKNEIFEKRKNILEAAGVIEPGETISYDDLEKNFSDIRVRVVDFNSGEILEGIDVATYDPIKSSKDLEASISLTKADDIAGIKRRENKGKIYEFLKNGEIETIVLPIRGYGLWSTLYGFLALDGSGKKVKGITYYDHAETPGLGGEVDNVKWKDSWKNKTAYGEDGEVVIKVLKSGKADLSSEFEIDGLGGATITTYGVDAMIKFWLGDKGYGSYLKKHIF